MMASPDNSPEQNDGDFVYGNLMSSRENATYTHRSIRRLAFSTVIGLLALALTFAVILSLHIPSNLSRTLHGAPLDHIAVISDLPWGIVSLDGKVIARLPDIHGDNALHLTHSKHTITFDAAPFLPQSCVISIPGISSDTCALSTLEPNASASVIAIYFLFSLKQLPAEQQQALIHVAQMAMNGITSIDSILPGEYYQAGAIRTTQLLQGTLHFSLDSGNLTSVQCPFIASNCLITGQNCRQFCSLGYRVVPVNQPNQTWSVFGVALPLWDYATADGRVLAANQPDAFGGAANRTGLLGLDIRWMGTAWQVTVPQRAPSPVAANDTLVDIGCASAQNTQDVRLLASPTSLGSIPLQWQYTSASQRAQGCLITAIPDFNAATPTIPYKAYLLYRSGSFVAVNAVAHNYWPYLPQADAHERAIAVSLGAQE